MKSQFFRLLFVTICFTSFGIAAECSPGINLFNNIQGFHGQSLRIQGCSDGESFIGGKIKIDGFEQSGAEKSRKPMFRAQIPPFSKGENCFFSLDANYVTQLMEWLPNDTGGERQKLLFLTVKIRFREKIMKLPDGKYAQDPTKCLRYLYPLNTKQDLEEVLEKKMLMLHWACPYNGPNQHQRKENREELRKISTKEHLGSFYPAKAEEEELMDKPAVGGDGE